MPGRYPDLNPATPKQLQRPPLEVRLANGLLGDEPRPFRPILALRDPRQAIHSVRSVAVSVPHFYVDDLHPRNVAFARLPRGHKSLAHSYVFGLHLKQLLAELFVDQG